MEVGSIRKLTFSHPRLDLFFLAHEKDLQILILLIPYSMYHPTSVFPSHPAFPPVSVVAHFWKAGSSLCGQPQS